MEIIPGTGYNVYQHEGTASDVFAIIKEWADDATGE